MTRGKWVALAVGLAAIAVLVPYGPALWRAVKYADERVEYGERVTIENGLDGRIQTIRHRGRSHGEPDYIVLSRKRFHWLSGPDQMIRCPFLPTTGVPTSRAS